MTVENQHWNAWPYSDNGKNPSGLVGLMNRGVHNDYIDKIRGALILFSQFTPGIYPLIWKLDGLVSQVIPHHQIPIQQLGK